MKVGVVGWGEIGRLHAESIRLAGAELGGVVSSKSDLQIGAPVFPTLRDMLPFVDAITIAVPNHLHAGLCIQAIDAGVAVMVEKPICVSREELRALEMRCSRLKAPVHIGYRLRFNRAIRNLREACLTPKRVQCTYRMGIELLAHGKEWTRRFSSTGGSFFTLGIHALDLCRWLTDARAEHLRLVSVQTADTTPAADYPLSVSMTGELSDGTLLVATADLRGRHHSEIEVVIDDESPRNYKSRLSLTLTEDLDGERIEYADLFSAFVTAIRNASVDQNYLPEALATHEDLIAARDSACNPGSSESACATNAHKAHEAGG